MTRLLAVFLAALMMSFAASAAQVPHLDAQATPEASAISVLAALEEAKGAAAEPCQLEAGTGDMLLAQGCCRVCRTGKACGNSCISRNYTCRQPRGCACNG